MNYNQITITKKYLSTFSIDKSQVNNTSYEDTNNTYFFTMNCQLNKQIVNFIMLLQHVLNSKVHSIHLEKSMKNDVITKEMKEMLHVA